MAKYILRDIQPPQAPIVRQKPQLNEETMEVTMISEEVPAPPRPIVLTLIAPGHRPCRPRGVDGTEYEFGDLAEEVYAEAIAAYVASGELQRASDC